VNKFNKIVYTKRKDKFIEKYNYGLNIVDLGEYVVRLSNYCPLECKYCFANELVKDKTTKIYTNYYKLKQELKNIRKKSDKTLYFNAGENADSLLFDNVFPITQHIIPIFNKYENTYLELRTKTDNIQNLLSIKNNRNIIVAFSISPEEIIKKYEQNTVSLERRIKALIKCQEAGYLTGLRFEPVINIKNLDKIYTKLIEQIRYVIDIKKLHSITLSTIRFTKLQYKKLIDKNCKIAFDEFVLCQDNKYRYFRFIRVKIYKTIISILKDNFKNICILLSTEPEYIWNDCNLEIIRMPEILK